MDGWVSCVPYPKGRGKNTLLKNPTLHNLPRCGKHGYKCLEGECCCLGTFKNQSIMQRQVGFPSLLIWHHCNFSRERERERKLIEGAQTPWVLAKQEGEKKKVSHVLQGEINCLDKESQIFFSPEQKHFQVQICLGGKKSQEPETGHQIPKCKKTACSYVTFVYFKKINKSITEQRFI